VGVARDARGRERERDTRERDTRERDTRDHIIVTGKLHRL